MKRLLALGMMVLFLVLGGGVWAADLIDLNTATPQQLESLPGIGPALAAKIIEYRQTKPFTSIEQIKEVKGIGDAKFEQIKNLITAGGSQPQANATGGTAAPKAPQQ